MHREVALTLQHLIVRHPQATGSKMPPYTCLQSSPSLAVAFYLEEFWL